ncbi:hypothetical protein DWE47_10950 [Salmonella enterica]|nr:hypothetical protein [Salmonella enterica]EAN8697479.1 hypothetical protein [Salmonella enterica]EBO6664735.1 hypothetical protein [Salmonella enterica]EBV1636105.1 hypothetical protein [Salmonella enterica subsp. enterica serovar Hvittingfoss]MMN05266.1 hypothetical protein [Salmonella enterica]
MKVAFPSYKKRIIIISGMDSEATGAVSKSIKLITEPKIKKYRGIILLEQIKAVLFLQINIMNNIITINIFEIWSDRPKISTCIAAIDKIKAMEEVLFTDVAIEYDV